MERCSHCRMKLVGRTSTPRYYCILKFNKGNKATSTKPCSKSDGVGCRARRK